MRRFRNKYRKSEKKLLKAFVSFFVLGGLLYFFIIKPLSDVWATINRLEQRGKALSGALKDQNLEQIKYELGGLDQDLRKAKSTARKYRYLNKVPRVSTYYADLEHLSEAGLHGVRVANILLEAVEPFSELLGFTGGADKSPTLDQEVNKVVGAVRVLPEVVKYLDQLEPEIQLVKGELDQIDPNRYPKNFKGKNLKEILSTVIEVTDKAAAAFPDAKKFLGKFPSFMGEGQPKTYLILFQNDKELRPTGGFLTAYALVTLKGGEVADVVSGDTYVLDNRIGLRTPPHPILKRDLKVDHWFARDANFSPDFVVSADKFYEFWQMVDNPKIDGIFAIDTYVPVELLRVLGPVKVTDYEEDFTHENVVEELESYATFLEEQPGRKKLIGLLMAAVEAKIFEAPKEQWSELFKAGIKLLNEKHVLLYAFDPEMQKIFEKYNLSGRVRDYEGDYLYVNDSNFAGGKANWYIKQRVTKEIKEENGKVISTVIIDYENPEPYNQKWNPGYRDYVRLLVPKGSKLVSAEGSFYEVSVEEDLGKTVFAAFNITRPEETSQIRITYELPENIVDFNSYKLLLQKQPGKNRNEYVVRVGDREEKLELNTDKEISL